MTAENRQTDRQTDRQKERKRKLPTLQRKSTEKVKSTGKVSRERHTTVRDIAERDTVERVSRESDSGDRDRERERKLSTL